MRRLQLKRTEDVNGISGTGIVAQGCEFDDGSIALTWLSHLGSHAFYDSLKVLDGIHGHGGRTVVEYLDAVDK